MMQEIYEALLGACSKFTLPERWHNIPCDPSFFCLPNDKTALLVELQKQFPVANLITAGIATTDAENSLVWHSQLAVDGAPLWAIRTSPNEKPTGLIAQMRTVGVRKWALSSTLLEHRQAELIAAANGVVVVAYSMADLAILRSIGIAALPGESWSQLSRDRFNYLCRKLGITSQAPQSHMPGATIKGAEEKSTLSLLMANWSLATLDPTHIDAAKTSWSHFVHLCQTLKLDFGDFGLWQPSDKNLKLLDCQLQYQSAQEIREGFLEGMEQDVQTIEAYVTAKKPRAETIMEATRAWQQAQRNEDQAESQSAFEQLSELQDRQLYEPLVEEALQAPNLLERNAMLALAEVSRLQQPLFLQLTEKLRRSIGVKGSRAGSGISKDELKLLMTLSGRAFDLTKGIVAWRQNKPNKTVLTVKPLEPHSKSSTSTPLNSPHLGRTEQSTTNNVADTPSSSSSDTVKQDGNA